MRSLELLQADFMQALVGATPPVLGSSRLEAAQTWAIYRRNHRGSHIAALADTYGTVLAVVGEAYFRQLARRYVDVHPSTSGDLNDYGEHFADFLDDLLPSVPGGEQLPYLSDLARLDWAWFAVLRAPAAPDDGLAGLASWPAEQRGLARARPHPASRLLASDYPLYRIWRLANGAEAGVDLGVGAECVLISRPGGQVTVSLLSPAEDAFLRTWFAGHSLDEALPAMMPHTPVLDLPAIFARLHTFAVVGALWSTPR